MAVALENAAGSRDTGPERRDSILESALLTFARWGYRKTSMESVAQSARITRPGLYFLFNSKEELFRSAVTQMLTLDLHKIEDILREDTRPLGDRLLAAFDQWAGRWVAPTDRAVTDVIENNPELAGPLADRAPIEFAGLVSAAIGRHVPDADRADVIATTLINTSIGLKHTVDTRAAYLQQMRRSIGLVLPDGA